MAKQPRRNIAIFVDVNSVVTDPMRTATMDWYKLWLKMSRESPDSRVVHRGAYVSAEALLKRHTSVEIEGLIRKPLHDGKFEARISSQPVAPLIMNDIMAVFWGDLQAALGPASSGESRLTFPLECRIVLVGSSVEYMTVFNTLKKFPDVISFEVDVWSWKGSLHEDLARYASRVYELDHVYEQFEKALLNPLLFYSMYGNPKP